MFHKLPTVGWARLVLKQLTVIKGSRFSHGGLLTNMLQCGLFTHSLSLLYAILCSELEACITSVKLLMTTRGIIDTKALE